MGQNDGNSAVVEEIDTVTIIGRRGDVADVPGSAHVVDNEELAEFIQSDILRVLRRRYPNAYSRPAPKVRHGSALSMPI